MLRRRFTIVRGGGVELPPNDEIWYTTDGTGTISPYDTGVFGATLVSNTRVGDKGILKFDGDVTQVGTSAFYNNSYASITLPNSVTSIGNRAFYNCSYLVAVNIPTSVNSIGSYAFDGCLRLSSVIIIPNGVTSISNYCFHSCESIPKIILPDSVTRINTYAFSGCEGLLEVNIPDGVTTIDTYAFHDSGITHVVIPQGVKRISAQTFYYCVNLREITIHENITQIGQAAFWRCTSLQKVYCERTTPPTGSSYMFNEIASDAKIYVPAGSGNAYKTANYWKNYASMIVEM